MLSSRRLRYFIICHNLCVVLFLARYSIQPRFNIYALSLQGTQFVAEHEKFSRLKKLKIIRIDLAYHELSDQES